MKKLTKTLSLVLVIAMVVSLCVVGASAKTFSDYKAPTTGTDYTEAIDVMSGIGIIEGMNGGFNAAGNFTRAQAAKIIAYMQLGVTKAEALSFNTNTAVVFKDVPTSHWAYNYIEYCAQQGIISGYGNGKFGPSDTLTGYQWTKMLLSAVGFGVNKEYNGVNWAINVARDGLKYGVFSAKVDATAGSLTYGTTALPRDVATGMAFNTLVGIQRVTYAALIGDYIDGTGNVVSGIGKTLNGLNTDGTLAQSVFALAQQSGRINWTQTRGFLVQSCTYGTINQTREFQWTGTAYAAKGVDYSQYGYKAHLWTVGSAQKTVVSNTYVDSKVIKTVGGGYGLNHQLSNSIYVGYCDPTSKNYVASIDGSEIGTYKTGYNPTTNTYTYESITGITVINTGSTSGASITAVPISSNGTVNGSAVDPAYTKGVAVTLLDEDGDGMVDAVAFLNKGIDTLSAKVSKTGSDGVAYTRVIGTSASIMDDYAKTSDVVGAADVAKGDVVLWFVDCTGAYHFAKAATVKGTIASSSRDDYARISYKIADKDYYITDLDYTQFANDYPVVDGKENTFYVDDFGNLAGDTADATDYVVYVFGYYSNIIDGQYASVMYADGTTAKIPVSKMVGFAADVNNLNNYNSTIAGIAVNEWALYSKTSATAYALNGDLDDNGYAADVYVVDLASANAVAISNKAAKFLTLDDGTVLKANSNTQIYVQQADKTFKVLTGVTSAPTGTIKGTYGYIADANGLVSKLIIPYSADNSFYDSNATVFFYGIAATKTYKDGVNYYTVKAVTGGEIKDVVIAGDALYNKVIHDVGEYVVTYSNNVVVAAELQKVDYRPTKNNDNVGDGLKMKNLDLYVDGVAEAAYSDTEGSATPVFYCGWDKATSSFTCKPISFEEVALLKNVYGDDVCVTTSKTDTNMLTCVVIYADSMNNATVTVDPVKGPVFAKTNNELTVQGGSTLQQIKDMVTENSMTYVGATDANGNTKALTATVAQGDVLTYETPDGYEYTFVVGTIAYTVAAPTMPQVNAADGITIKKISADKTFVAAGASVTYTVTYTGTATNGVTITFTAPTTGVTAPATVTKALSSGATDGSCTFVCTNATANVNAASVTIAETPAPT